MPQNERSGGLWRGSAGMRGASAESMPGGKNGRSTCNSIKLNVEGDFAHLKLALILLLTCITNKVTFLYLRKLCEIVVTIS